MSNVIDDDEPFVVGFRIKKFVVTEGKGENSTGNVQLHLEASKEDIRAFDKNMGDIVAAFNMHQTAKEPVVLKLRFPDED